MKIYLSGPMSGLPDDNFPAFNAMAAKLRAAGYTVVNPAELDEPNQCTWQEYLRRDLIEMLHARCETVARLPGWESSRGARLEIHVARELGFVIFDAEKLLELAPTCIEVENLEA